MVEINGALVQTDEFGWDECHKIYLVTTEEGRKELLDLGYRLYPIRELRDCWEKSCSLRFISSADLTTTFVQQGHKATIKEV